MSHQTVDVEAQKSGRRRGSCLDAFLVASVLFLFVAVAALAVGGVMAMKGLQPRQLPSFQMPEHTAAGLIGGTPSPAFKMQNFAYLELTQSELQNTTLAWTPVNYADGVSLGSNYVFNEEQFSLKPLREGVYFMYMNLHVTCVHKCKAGVLKLSVGDSLSCDVELSANETSVRKQCWAVRMLHVQSMVIKMTVSKGLHNWKLELPGSDFGIFLVD